MAYDENVARRLRSVLVDLPDISEVKMMGGLCFLTEGNMIGGTHIDKSGRRVLMFRVGKKNMMEALGKPGASTMISGSRPMNGMVRVDDQDCPDDALNDWVNLTMRFVGSLPPKVKA